VYYGIDEGRIVLLLGGGTKRGQARDVRKAIDRWTTYKERKKKR
jgi:putative component of toxin-antitoxin plasmid stabilization module